jgi:N-acetylglucosamine-6-phosphate deacetylase
MSRSTEALPKRFVVTNGRVILPNGVTDRHAVLVEDGRIITVAPEPALPAGLASIDAGGRYIAPGLIDIHTHGALGHSFNEHNAKAFAIITGAQAACGVTALLVTIATAPIEDIVRCCEVARTAMTRREGTQILGVHLEGPYFSVAQRGAQDPAHMRTPDDGSVDRYLEHHDITRIVSFAPELPGAIPLTRRLVKLGIVPAAGHSSAKDADILAAMKAGLRHTIHIWSSQSTTIREGPWRKPGLLEATLTFDGLTGEMISDNRHLPPTLMKLAYKCLGPDRLCAISDSTNGAGLPEGTHFGMGDMVFDVHDGVGMTLDRTSFAGSTTLLNRMVAILVKEVGIPLAEAVRMASLTPARVIGYGDRKGSLAAGKDADIAIFEDDFTVWRTIIRGEWAYRAPNAKAPRRAGAGRHG